MVFSPTKKTLSNTKKQGKDFKIENLLLDLELKSEKRWKILRRLCENYKRRRLLASQRIKLSKDKTNIFKSSSQSNRIYSQHPKVVLVHQHLYQKKVSLNLIICQINRSRQTATRILNRKTIKNSANLSK